jgi:zinc protease
VPDRPDVVRGRFANGLEWLHVERRGLPIVDVHMVVRAGAELAPDGLSGRVVLAGEALEEGTLTRSGFEVADAVDRLGASLRIQTGWDETTVALHVLAEQLPEGLGIGADVVRYATFPEAEVRRRRVDRVAGLIQDRDEAAALAARAIARSVYGESHPYGRSPSGTCESVGSLERDALAHLHRTYFLPDTTFVVSVGDCGPGEIEGLLDATLGDWSGGARPAVQDPPAPAGRVEIALVDRPGASQSELRIGSAGPPRRTPDHAALIVLNTILGGAFTSRLNLKLREEKGFTYGARSGFGFRRHGGPFVAATAVATGDTAEAVDDALREIRRMSREPVPAHELERARRYMVLGLPRRLETGSAMAAQLADLHLHGLTEDELVDVIDRIAEVTAEDVLEAATRWLDPDALTVVVVGDAGRIRRSLEDLDLNVHDRTVVI